MWWVLAVVLTEEGVVGAPVSVRDEPGGGSSSMGSMGSISLWEGETWRWLSDSATHSRPTASLIELLFGPSRLPSIWAHVSAASFLSLQAQRLWCTAGLLS